MTISDLEQASGSSTDSVELAKVQNVAGATEPVNAAENAAAGATTIGRLHLPSCLLLPDVNGREVPLDL